MDDEDDLFYVLKGRFKMEYRNENIEIENEFVIVPRGTEHRPVESEDVAIILFEPKSTLNTGDTLSGLTKNNLPMI